MGPLPDATALSVWGTWVIPPLVDASIKGAIILSVAQLATRLMPRSSAAWRYGIWMLAIFSLPVLSILKLSLPPLAVLPPPTAALFKPVESPTTPVAEFSPRFPRLTPAMRETTPVTEPNADATENPAAAVSASVPSPVRSISITAPAAARRVPPLNAWGWMLILWMTGLLILLCDALIGAVMLRRLRFHATEISDARLLELALQLRDRLSIDRPILFLQSPSVMPMTWGLFRPVVLLPLQATDWSRDRQRAVLLHELGHIKRQDCLSGWGIRLVRCIYWFHPLVWLASRRLTIERENACDDLVLRHGENAPDYAEHLLQVAMCSVAKRFTTRSAVAMARQGRIDQRLRAILKDRINRSPLGRRTGWCLACAAAVVVIPLAMLAGARRVSGQVAATQPLAPIAKAHVAIKTIDTAGNAVPLANLFLVQDSYSFPVCKVDGPNVSVVTRTDATGVASVQFPADVKTNIMAWATGYAPVFIRAATLSSDQPFEIHFDAGQSVVGSISASDGSPLANAHVHAVRKNFPVDYMEQFQLSGTTDSSGKFKLDHAAAGDYQLSAQSLKADPSECFTPIDFKVDLDQGPARLHMQAGGGAVFKGKMYSSHGVMVGNRVAIVSIRLPAHSQHEFKTAADGSFVIDGIPAGSKGGIYFSQIGGDITETSWSSAPSSCKTNLDHLDFDHVPPGVYEGIEVHLYQPGKVTGTVLDDSGMPIDDLWVEVLETHRLFKTDKQGRYTALVPPGMDAHLQVEYNFGRQTALVHLDENQSAEHDFKFIRAVDPPHRNEITGRVVDAAGKPVGGAQVSLGNNGVLAVELVDHDPKNKAKLTWSDPTFAPAYVITDAQGTFRFNELRAGKTDIWAQADGSRWCWDRDVDSNRHDLELKVQPPQAAGQFSGTVTDDQGQLLQGAKVYLSNRGHGVDEILSNTSTDAQGRFSISTPVLQDQPADWVYLVARSPGGACTWKVLPLCGGSDIALRFRPQASVHGRLMNHKGQPLGGAAVWFYQGQDREWGDIFFYNKMKDIAPQTTTAADGTFTLAGLPLGCEVSFTAKHPDYQPTEDWHVMNVQPGTVVDDMVADDGITIGGKVRMAGSNQPVAGAAVDLMADDEPLANTVSDAQGNYRFNGVEHMWLAGKFGVEAKIGAGPDYEGSASSDVSLNAGDAKTDLDVVVDKSFAARQAEWLTHRGTAPTSACHVAVVDALDAASKHLNAVTVYDDAFKILWQQKQLDFSDGWDCQLTTNPIDHSLVLYNDQTGQFTGFSRDGSLLYQRSLEKYFNATAIDPTTGNLWALKTSGTIYGSGIAVYSPAGEKLHDWKINGAAIAYSPHDHCFWVSGSKLLKVGLDGKVIIQSPIAFSWLARDLAVDPTDGSVWVAESAHPDLRLSRNQLYIVDADGQVRHQLDVGDQSAGHIELDPSRATAWINMSQGIARCSMDGVIQSVIPVNGDLCLEPDTGCIWVAGPAGVVRINPDGVAVSVLQTTAVRKRICVIAP